MASALITLPPVFAQTTAASPAPEGSIQIQSTLVPYSDVASPEAKRNFIETMKVAERLDAASQSGDVLKIREAYDREMQIPGLARLRKVFDVQIKEEKIGGVLTDVVTPTKGISPANGNRVLINLHGGGFIVGGRYAAQMESVPIASLGGIKVITVDYRMAPEAHYPAATEDVEKVYRELLKTYRPENIGIYGCSAGAMLSSQSVVWFQTHNLPRPGAIGMFGFGAGGKTGDATYISALLNSGKISTLPPYPNYFEGANMSDPVITPLGNDKVLSAYPPSLLLTGTRDIGLSSAIHTHARLVGLGVDADLHVWDGAPHCSFAQGVVDPDVPETRQAWDVTVKFFDRHLGKQKK